MKIAIVLLLAASACAKHAKPASPTRVSSGAPATGGPDTRQTAEVARGDVREAILHLRRVHFAYDTDALLPESRASLAQAAERLAAHPEVAIYVDGHTDERGTSEYNIALGDRRANTVIDYLVRLGIERSRLSAVSFGAHRPLEPGHHVDDLAANRRVEFRLVRGDLELVLDEGPRYDDRGTVLSARAPQ